MSMPAIASAKPAPQIKFVTPHSSQYFLKDLFLIILLSFRNLTSTLPTTSITSSPSFPSQLTSNQQTMPMPLSHIPPAQTPLKLNSNFLSDLSQIGSNNGKGVPMNQMMSLTPSTFSAAQPSSFQNSPNSLSTLSPIIAKQSNSAQKNGQDSTIALSAQEINDFLG